MQKTPQGIIRKAPLEGNSKNTYPCITKQYFIIAIAHTEDKDAHIHLLYNILHTKNLRGIYALRNGALLFFIF